MNMAAGNSASPFQNHTFAPGGNLPAAQTNGGYSTDKPAFATSHKTIGMTMPLMTQKTKRRRLNSSSSSPYRSQNRKHNHTSAAKRIGAMTTIMANAVYVFCL